MIDIHSHILPAVDDGSKDLETSLIMARMACEAGTRKMMATPHFCFDFNELEDIDQLKESYLRFKKQLEENKIDLELYLGLEILYTDELLEVIKKNNLYGLNGTKYLLVEFDFSDSPDYIVEAVAKIKAYGYIPILAHPERYQAIWHHFELLDCLVAEGILCQCNAGSLFGYFGHHAKDTMKRMLDYGFVHFIGSDCHGINRRNSQMIDCYDYICKYYSVVLANRVFKENPLKVIEGE